MEQHTEREGAMGPALAKIRPGLIWFAISRLGVSELGHRSAEDLVQEALTRGWQKWDWNNYPISFLCDEKNLGRVTKFFRFHLGNICLEDRKRIQRDWARKHAERIREEIRQESQKTNKKTLTDEWEDERLREKMATTIDQKYPDFKRLRVYLAELEARGVEKPPDEEIEKHLGMRQYRIANIKKAAKALASEIRNRLE